MIVKARTAHRDRPPKPRFVKNKPSTEELKPQAPAYTAGYKAFRLGVPFFGNTYHKPPHHGLWINGYKRAEKDDRIAWVLSNDIEQQLDLKEQEQARSLAGLLTMSSVTAERATAA